MGAGGCGRRQCDAGEKRGAMRRQSAKARAKARRARAKQAIQAHGVQVGQIGDAPGAAPCRTGIMAVAAAQKKAASFGEGRPGRRVLWEGRDAEEECPWRTSRVCRSRDRGRGAKRCGVHREEAFNFGTNLGTARQRAEEVCLGASEKNEPDAEREDGYVQKSYGA